MQKKINPIDLAKEHNAKHLYDCIDALAESCHLTQDESNILHAAIAHWDVGGQDFWLTELARTCALKALHGIQAGYIGDPKSQEAQSAEHDALVLASFFDY